MSNDVRGYLVPQGRSDDIKYRLRECAVRFGLGISFPLIIPGLVPPEGAILYRISDGPQSQSAEYLVDMEDYAEGAVMQLPLAGVERIRLLGSWVESVIRSEVALAVVVSVTDANFMDGEVQVTPESFWPCLLADSQTYAPPNQTYVIAIQPPRSNTST